MRDYPMWVPVAAGAFGFFVVCVGIVLVLIFAMTRKRLDSKITGRGR